MLIKDFYNIEYVKDVARQIEQLCSSFDRKAFVVSMQKRLADQCFGEKLDLIAEHLHKYLPNYPKALEIFSAMLGEKLTSMRDMYEAGLPYAPFGRFIEKYAPLNEDYFPQTTSYIRELTQRFTGEFAMRPLLNTFPQKTISTIKEWTDDKSDCVRRLSSECMRIGLPWARKLNFALEYFDEYCAILLKLSDDECEYVRRSVANNLNELCKADLPKAKILIAKLKERGGKEMPSLIKHGTRWARKKGLL